MRFDISLKAISALSNEGIKYEFRSLEKSNVDLSLDVQGPKTVYSSDLIFSDENISAAFEGIPIVKLLENQDIKFTANAKLGIGKDHVKHSPCAVFYINKPKLKINNDSKKFQTKSLCEHRF